MSSRAKQRSISRMSNRARQQFIWQDEQPDKAAVYLQDGQCLRLLRIIQENKGIVYE